MDHHGRSAPGRDLVLRTIRPAPPGPPRCGGVREGLRAAEPVSAPPSPSGGRTAGNPRRPRFTPTHRAPAGRRRPVAPRSRVHVPPQVTRRSTAIHPAVGATPSGRTARAFPPRRGSTPRARTTPRRRVQHVRGGWRVGPPQDFHAGPGGLRGGLNRWAGWVTGILAVDAADGANGRSPRGPIPSCVFRQGSIGEEGWGGQSLNSSRP